MKRKIITTKHKVVSGLIDGYGNIVPVSRDGYIGGSDDESVLKYEANQEAVKAALKDYIKNEPASRLLKYVKRSGDNRGELPDFTLRQFRQLNGYSVSRINTTKDRKHVRWEYTLDKVATEIGYRDSDELYEALQSILRAHERLG